MQTFIDPGVAWTLILGFTVLWLALGYFWGRRVRTTEDYLFAGRNVGMALATSTLFAAWVTGNTTLAAPEVAYNVGVWGMIGYSLAGFGLLYFAPLSLRIRKLMPRGYTSGDFVRTRYDRKTWYLFLFISAVYFIGWLITQGMGAGLVLQAVSGIDYRVGMLVVVGTTTIYVLLGGMRAIIGTDFMQALMIMILLVPLAVLAYSQIGIETVYNGLMSNAPDRLNLLVPAGLFYAWNTCLFSMGEIFHSNVWWQRAFSFRPEVNARAFLLSGVTWLTVPIVTGSLAFVALAQQYQVPQVNMVFPIVTGQLLGPIGGALVLLVVFASLASTINALLGATSDLLVRDIYQLHFKPNATDEEMRRMARWIIVGLGLLTIALSWQYITSMYLLLLFTGALVGSTIWPIATGIYWRHASRNGAFWGMLLGSAVGLWSYFAIAPYAAALLGAAVSAVVVVIFSRIQAESFDFGQLRTIGLLPSVPRVAGASGREAESETREGGR